MSATHPVIASLRNTLSAPRSSDAFRQELGGRIQQLLSNMVDGRVLPKPDAEALRTSLLEFLRSEALTTLAHHKPSAAIGILDMLKMYGYTQLESERARLGAASAAKFPLPAPPTWPELTELRALAAKHPDVCSIAAPVQAMAFSKELEDDGLHLPEDLLAFYAWADGFDLACVVAPYLPVFSVLPSKSIDVSDAVDGYPRRPVVLVGGDSVQFSVYRDHRQWWLVYEYDFRPLAKKPLDLPQAIRFGIQRMLAPSDEALDVELSWDRLFELNGQ
ncbi:MAG: hypothetical protein AB7O24_34065 [Kofleriaceae bacterium]